MKGAPNNSVSRLLQVFECLYADDFSPKSALDIVERTDIPMTSVWRILKTLETQGWAVNTSQKTWKVSDKMLGIAEAYELHAIRRVQAIRDEYRSVTGKELKE